MRIGSGTAAVIAITLIAAGGAYGASPGSGQAERSAWRWLMVQQAEPAMPPEQRATPPEQPTQESRPSAAPSIPAATPPAATSPTGTPAVVLDDQEVSGIVGKSVRSNADEDMGRIVDVIVNEDGHVRAAIIDFGGFLGIGTRKIAVDWRALKFSPAGKPGGIMLDLTRNQVRVAPEYKRGEPLVVVGPAGPERTMPSTDAATPEK
jgi:PRC-barrel domain